MPDGPDYGSRRRRAGSRSRDARASVIRNSVGVGVATGAYGISFGAIAIAAGLNAWQTCALSLLVFTGASQFALVGVLGSGGAPVTGAVSAVLLGSRNALYGLRLTPLLRLRGPRRVAAAQIVIDESTAMAVAQPTPELARTGFFATGLSVFVLWNLGTLVGVVAGSAIGDPRTYGLDAAVGAAFLGLLWPQLKTTEHRVVAVIGAVAALGLVPVSTPGVPVLAAGAVAVIAGVARRSA
jgi:4-azaleucine resistance transporter AzlC